MAPLNERVLEAEGAEKADNVADEWTCGHIAVEGVGMAFENAVLGALGIEDVWHTGPEQCASEGGGGRPNHRENEKMGPEGLETSLRYRGSGF